MTEYHWLALQTLFFLLAFLPASVAKKKSYGLGWLASNRDSPPKRPLPTWGERAERAHNNLKDNFPAFAVAILLLGSTGKFSEFTQVLAAIYVISRALHMITYISGHAAIRSVSYFAALVANILLLIKALV